MTGEGLRCVAIVLAAGGGTRFRGTTHKLLADLGGRPVHRHAIDAALDAGIGPVVVVAGAAELDLPAGVHVVRNERWADGQATSLHAGIGLAGDLGAEAAVVGLGDQPFVPPSAWRAVASAEPAWPIVVATYHGRRGPNPVRLHRSTWPALPTTGDEGARTLLRSDPGQVHEVACDGSAADIDTVEDLHRWTSS